MNNGTHRNRRRRAFKGTGWILGSAVASLLVSAGLEFFVRQTVDQTSLPTILELLYLAFWTYVAGVVLLIVAPVWLFISWMRAWLTRRAVDKRARSKPVQAESRSGRFERRRNRLRSRGRSAETMPDCSAPPGLQGQG